MEEEEKKVEVSDTELEKGESKEENLQEIQKEKTFTQKELDEIIENRLAKAKKGIPSKEELDNFNKWKESQKTEEEKKAEVSDTELEKGESKEENLQEIQKEKDNLKRENLLLRKGVNDYDLDYVMFKVSKQEGEFEENLTHFLNENPRFLKGNEVLKTVDLGGEHISTNNPDLSKMDYNQYKEYRKNNR